MLLREKNPEPVREIAGRAMNGLAAQPVGGLELVERAVDMAAVAFERARDFPLFGVGIAENRVRSADQIFADAERGDPDLAALETGSRAPSVSARDS